MATPTAEKEVVCETIRTVLADYPVTVGVLFGSLARGDTTEASDIDVAVAFDADTRADAQHADQRLALSTDLALELGTDDVDVVDLRAASPGLVRAVFTDGVRLVGTEQDAQQLREQLVSDTERDSQSPADRFDDALAALDDHLA